MEPKKVPAYLAPCISDTGLTIDYKFISQYCGNMPIETVIEITACLDYICETVLRLASQGSPNIYINKKPLVHAVSCLFKDNTFLKRSICADAPWDFHEVLQMIAGEHNRPHVQSTKTTGTNIKRPTSLMLNSVLWSVFKELTKDYTPDTPVLNYDVFIDDAKNNMMVVVAAAVNKYNERKQGKVLLA